MINLNGIHIKADFPCISEYMKSRLAEGRYEIAETKLIPEMLQNGDSVLEVGGGIGYLSSLVFKTGNCSDLVVIEANPDLIPVIHANHLLNGVSAFVIHGVPQSNDSQMDCDFIYQKTSGKARQLREVVNQTKRLKRPLSIFRK
jgi:tRNA G37 N-methylase Trm5